MSASINTIELFAGVGGFRIGLQARPEFNFVWANQWEPGKKSQPAHSIYTKRFGANSCLNQDISTVSPSNIPPFDLLTAGFPCQDYSVAKSLKYSSGLEGKKGVLWWNIHSIVSHHLPPYLLLENVDRLVSSPAKQKGRDFAIILKTLSDLGYFVEWRIINAADYGCPQKRKRIFIFACNSKSLIFSNLISNYSEVSVLNNAFPVIDNLSSANSSIDLTGQSLLDISDSFGKSAKLSPFKSSGMLFNSKGWTRKDVPDFTGKKQTLGDCLEPLANVPPSFLIAPSDIPKWEVFKLGRKINRISKETGHEYVYAEGKMAFPDSPLNPSRTIITGEGGASPSRFKHVVVQDGSWRRLLPIELERLNMFPDNHTEGVPDTTRAFLMGNALVTGLVTRIGNSLVNSINKSQRN